MVNKKQKTNDSRYFSEPEPAGPIKAEIRENRRNANSVITRMDNLKEEEGAATFLNVENRLVITKKISKK